jgi:hypothetical protein
MQLEEAQNIERYKTLKIRALQSESNKKRRMNTIGFGKPHCFILDDPYAIRESDQSLTEGPKSEMPAKGSRLRTEQKPRRFVIDHSSLSDEPRLSDCEILFVSK